MNVTQIPGIAGALLFTLTHTWTSEASPRRTFEHPRRRGQPGNDPNGIPSGTVPHARCR